jgi:tRNA-dihydrouridine synthase B
VSEMVSAKPDLRATEKSQRRINHVGEPDPIAVQIAGADPAMMADAARYNVDHGAQIIDINMGCPAKKVCNVAAGSALLKDEQLVARILEAVVDAVKVPVTLKFRTGWDTASRNALAVAHMAEESGIQLLTLHGRTRACGYVGPVEYDSIAAVKAAARIPIIANGDINTPQRAKAVLAYTGADGVMVGRGAQGRPWIFREIEHYLTHGETPPAPLVAEIHAVLMEHLHELYELYGPQTGTRVARKHISWYTRDLENAGAFRQTVNRLESCEEQLAAVEHYFELLASRDERVRYEGEINEASLERVE